MNAAEIKTACKIYNADYPESFAEIDAGSPVVIARYSRKTGSQVTLFTAFIAVRFGDTLIGARAPELKEVRGRISGSYGDIAYRFARQYVSDSIPVEVVPGLV